MCQDKHITFVPDYRRSYERCKIDALMLLLLIIKSYIGFNVDRYMLYVTC